MKNKNAAPTRIAVFVVFALVGSFAQAATPTNAAFTKTGGDFASVEDWGGTVADPSQASGYQLQIGYSGTYYISSDINFASLLVDPWGSQITIDCLTKASARPKIRLNNSVCSGVVKGSLNMNGSQTGYLTIKGGDWNLGGGALNFKVRTNHSYEYNTVTFTDSAVVTNAGRLSVYKSPHQYLDIAGNSSVFASSAYVGAGISDQCMIRVYDGGYLHVEDGGIDIPGAYTEGNTYEGSAYCELRASGKGSRVYGASPKNGLKLQIGAGGTPGRLVVTDGAEFVSDYGENYLGTHTNAHLNLIRVADGGSLFMTNALYMSYKPFNGCGARWRAHPQDASNRLEVAGGGVYTNAELVAIRYAGNTLAVSNATAAIVRLYVTGTNNCVVLQGATPKLRINYNNDATYVSNKKTGARSAMCSWFNDDTELRFEMPPEGYAEDHVPLEVYRDFALWGDSKLQIAGAEAFMAKFSKGAVTRRTMTLIRCLDGTLDISDAKLSAAQATLPKGFRLKIKDNCLLLTATRSCGLMVVFR